MFYWFLTVFVDLKVIDTYRHHGSKWGYKLGIKSVFCHWPNPQKPSESGSNCTNRKGTQTKICQKQSFCGSIKFKTDLKVLIMNQIDFYSNEHIK